MLKFSIFILIVSALEVSAQPDSLWSQTFGGTGVERARSVQQTFDSGYVIAGTTASSGAGLDDFWLIKTNANGDSLWSRTFGGPNGETCHSVKQTSDSGYVLVGITNSFGAGGGDFWLVKTNANGDSLWSRTFGGVVGDQCYEVIQTPDDGYILAGYTNSFGAGGQDFWLVKVNANGDSLWSNTFGGSLHEICYDISETSDGGFALAGHTTSFSQGSFSDFWLVKTDANGDSLWSRTFGGGTIEYCYAMQQTFDGGYFLAGSEGVIGAQSPNFWMVKTDANGNSVWNREIGGELRDVCYSVQQTSDSGYALAGYANSFGAGGSDFWLLKMDPNGDSLWSRTFGGTLNDECFALRQTSDGEYVLAGHTASFGAGSDDVWLVKTGTINASCIQLSPVTLNFGEVPVDSQVFASFWIISTGLDSLIVDNVISDQPQFAVNDIETVIAPGESLSVSVSFEPSDTLFYEGVITVYSNAGDSTIACEGRGIMIINGMEDESIPLPSTFSLSAFPNPFNPATTIAFDLVSRSRATVNVHNIAGQIVTTLLDETMNAGSHSISFDGSNLSSGVYFVRLKTPNESAVQKIVLMK